MSLSRRSPFRQVLSPSSASVADATAADSRRARSRFDGSPTSGVPRLLKSGVAMTVLLAVMTLLAHDAKRTASPVLLPALTAANDASSTSGEADEPGIMRMSMPSASALATSEAAVPDSAPARGHSYQVAEAELDTSPAPTDRQVDAMSPVSGPTTPEAVGAVSRSLITVALATGRPQAATTIKPSSINTVPTTSPSTSAAQGTPTATSFSVAPLSFAVSPLAVTLAAHPRLILDASTLAALRQRATANTAEWKQLKASCDSFIGGIVEYPTGNAYPDLPNLGSGYQGLEYLPALLDEAMCYQVLKSSNPTAAATYGAKAVDILMKMSTPYSTGSGNQGVDPCTDDGYGIRTYGVGYGLGYDWLYELLTSAQRSQVYTTANAWITAWEAPGGCADFAYGHPQSNYYAGYFHAKAVISLATYDENSSAPAQWTDWRDNQFAQRVQPYYEQHLLGGGWPEGYGNYAPLAILNMSLPAREVKTATGQDLVHAAAPYTFPLASADYAMHFTWPSRSYFDDRDTNHSNGSTPQPGTAPVGMYQQILGDLIYWSSSSVGVFNQYLDAVKTATGNYSPTAPWMLFLVTDASTATAALSTLPLSYLAKGMNAVAARSDWGTGATWMSFRAGPYVNNPSQGEEYFDQGSLALVRGGNPLLVNAGGWLVHDPGGNADENHVYNDNYGNFDGSPFAGNRQLYNVFYVRNMSGATVLDPYGQGANTTEDDGVRTQVSAYEGGANHVYVLATHLEDMYRTFSAGTAVSAWSRQVVYFPPSRFVVYDRTTKGSAGYDQFLAWHFPANPVAGTAPAGQTRLDVTYNGQYMGAMIDVLPVNTTSATVSLYPGDNPVKVWQVQVRPPDTTVSQKWVTVFDLSTAAANVAAASQVTINQGGIVGVELLASNGNSVLVSSAGTAGAALAMPIGYRVSAVAAYHVVTDLTPATGYTVTTAANGSARDISVALGGTSMSSAQGVLGFYVTSAGVVQPNPPPVSAPAYPTVPVSSLPVPGSPTPYKP